ncbi:GNAT family N-acetyltransferase [Fimbriimonas ginsengisoli]|uniref:GCN5-related N-acetyltransferase n=1 Tax=Fimbriimonas ginsengisoli Gsoil 348 TaxID=661478 RepID=A0A068NW76_FIMGI|nr:GNAT family N-acetyltransferase [Fimbriimonas ginsengisoli]AIE87701.1 GCN5-related N-acetyltransferase [Fimbriimonas ginsengisoli Gsoil 348]
MVTAATPILASADILATLKFYQEVLGFESSWTWGEPPVFGAVIWGPVTIMFNLQPELAGKVAGHQLAINADPVDEIYSLHLERGAKIASPLEDKPWGIREYIVEDLHGYHLRVSGPIPAEVKPSIEFPEGVTVERRLPTEAEFAELARAVFDRKETPESVVERSWQGVVACSPDGDVIGMVRIVYDAPGWFSIWDVAVLPQWQGRRIGQRLMQEALAIIRDEWPGAWVFLFTYKHGFYERLGFSEKTVSMRRV